MKIKKIMFYIFMFLPLFIVLIALPFLPEQIPAHYGMDNQVTRWGSKYEAFIYPVTTILMGYFLLAMAKLAAKQEEHGKNNEKVVIITGIAVLAYFNIMNLFSLYTAFNKVENLSSVAFNIWQLVFGLLGAVMIVTGNIMPKLRMNSMIGLRTKWSMKNETTWKNSQRFGGISFIVGGIVIVVICFLAKGIYSFLWTMGVIAILLAIDICYTYRLSRKY